MFSYLYYVLGVDYMCRLSTNTIKEKVKNDVYYSVLFPDKIVTTLKK